MKITEKTEMYRLLGAGMLGNTSFMWMDLDQVEWKWEKYGVRSFVAGGECWLNLDREGVEKVFVRGKHQISVMIDGILDLTCWMQVVDLGELVVEVVEYPLREWNWRSHFKTCFKEYRGVMARMMMRKHLNANSYDDLMELLERYEGAVIELSCAEQCFGTVQGRNGIIWEVRHY